MKIEPFGVEIWVNEWGFCVALLKETGVMFTPGSTLDMEGYVRVGYAKNPTSLKEGLKRVSAFLADRS